MLLILLSSEGLAKKGHSLAKMLCLRKCIEISVFLQICIQPLYTDPLVYSRSVEIHAQHTERPKLNGRVQNTFQ